MPEKVKITKTKLDNLANAVAAKSGQPVLLTVDQMTDAVLGINLGEENILEGVKVNNVELPIVDKKVNIPAATVSSSNYSKLATAGVITQKLWDNISDNFDYFDIQVNSIYSQIESINNAGYITEETDPTVPSWAKQSTKPIYTATEVGALPSTTTIPSKTSDLTNDSGFVKRFVITITGNDDGYSADKTFSEIVTAYQNGYEIVCHCMIDNSFIPFLALSDDLIQFELSAMRPDDTLAAEYVSITSTNNITHQFMSFTETDPTVPSWAKASTKPSYNFSEIGSTPTTIGGYGITDAYTKTQIDGLVAGVLHYKGTKAAVSNLPTSGNTTGDTWHITTDGSEWAWDGTTWQELGTAVDLSNYVTTNDSRLSDARTPTAHNQALSTITGADDLKAIEGLTGTSGLLKKTAANTWTLDTSNYLTSYIETDPVFSASAAAGISATDISNWNAKVSDDKTWNGVALSKTTGMGGSNIYVPYTTSTSNSSMSFWTVSQNPTNYAIAKYDSSSYLYSTTPSANDNSTKVATTAYVDAAIPNVSEYVSKSGDTMSGRLTLNYSDGAGGLRIYGLNETYTDIQDLGYVGNTTNYTPILKFRSGKSNTANSNQFRVLLEGIANPTSNDDAANKEYVDNAIPKVYSSTNTSGYLTMATLPIYDGTVI